MTKTELFQTILQVVSEVCDVPSQAILSKARDTDICDARNIFVFHCFSYGLSVSSIARYLNRSRTESINKSLSLYYCYSKQSASIRLMSNEVALRLHERYPINCE